MESSYKRDRKKELNRMILEAIVQETRGHNVPLTFLFFPADLTANADGWREKFVRQEAQRLNVPLMDARTILMEATRKNGEDFNSMYSNDGHPSRRANELIANSLSLMMRSTEQ